MRLQELVNRRNTAADRAVAGLTSILRLLQPCCETAQQAQVQKSLRPLTRLGPEENRTAVKCLCESLDAVQAKAVDEGVKLDQRSIKTEAKLDITKYPVCNAHVTGSEHALPSDGAHMLHVSMEDAMWDQMDPAAVRLCTTCCVGIMY